MALMVKKTKEKKHLLANGGDARDAGSIPGLGRSLGGGHGNPLQDSYLENPMGRGAWRLQSRGLKESDTTEQLSVAQQHVAGASL